MPGREPSASNRTEAGGAGSREKLLQSQKLEALGQLTGGVAHDFNNLLTVVMGNADLLSEALAGDPILKKTADLIGEAAARGAQLTKALLAFSRRQPLQPLPVDVNALVRETDGLLRRTLGEHIEMALALENGLPAALIDPAELQGALVNLALNARDAMPGGGKLTIETGEAHLDDRYVEANPEARAGSYVLLAVSDTGHGIAPEAMERIFEPFYTTRKSGTGLGLSMVYGFVKQSGGHIKLYSEVSIGTTAKLYIPASAEAAPGSGLASPAATVGGKERVLVVEDNAPVRQNAVRQLETLGYIVLTASTAAEALAILAGGAAVDLLFTDVVMPGGTDGAALAREAQSRWPRLRVLFTSGYTENAIVHNGRLDPGVRLLAKPYRIADLARMVRAVLDAS